MPARITGVARRLLSAFIAALILAPAFAAAQAAPQGEQPKPHAWEKEIGEFEQQDREHPPEPGVVVFVGSSSIRMWDLKKSFPDLNAVNRGFGGSHIADSAYFAKRIVTPYKPRLVILHSGTNDLASGKSPDEVLRDFKAFVEAVRAESPETPILFIAIKPTVARWSIDDKVRAANAAIRQHMSQGEKLIYVDAYPPFLGSDGKPRADLLLPDGLHLNEKGYEVLSDLVRPYLKS